MTVDFRYSIGVDVAFLDRKGQRRVGKIQRVKIIVSGQSRTGAPEASVYYDIHDREGSRFRDTHVFHDVPQDRVLHTVFNTGESAGSKWEQAQARTNEKYRSMFEKDEGAGPDPFFTFNGDHFTADDFTEFFKNMAGQFRREEEQARRTKTGSRSKKTTDASEEAKRKAEEENRKKKWEDDFFARMRGGASDDHWTTLGIPKGSPKDEVKKAWRRKVMEWHPDRNQHRVKEAEEMMKKINKAYEALYY